MRRLLPPPGRLVALLAPALAVWLAGCAHPGSPARRAASSAALAGRLAALDAGVDPGEAARLAEIATEYAAALAREFRPARPAWFNNILVNSGLRERGLCYHWANELFARLRPLGWRTLEVHLAVAHLDTAREHNAVVVTARGRPWSEGLVLDAWRRGGRLHVVQVAGDARHPWTPLPRSAMRPELRALADAPLP